MPEPMTADSATQPIPAETARRGRKNNPEKTRQDILRAAIDEFVPQGLSGARVDAIAERTHTSKRMIYYYFGSKEQLYQAVLEKLYSDIRGIERTLHLAALPPAKAMRRLVEFTFDHHDRHVDFVRIISIENIHKGQFASGSEAIRSMNSNILRTIEDILQRGATSGVFRAGLEALDVHMLISSFCFYRVSNRYTVSRIFRTDLHDAEVRQRHRDMIVEAVLRYVQP